MDAIPAIEAEGAGGASWTGRAAMFTLQLAGAALDILYPPTCLSCRAATDAHGALCPRCWGAMRFIERPFCERLGTPFEHDLGPGLISPPAWPIRLCSREPGPWRGSRTARRARSSIA